MARCTTLLLWAATTCYFCLLAVQANSTTARITTTTTSTTSVTEITTETTPQTNKPDICNVTANAGRSGASTLRITWEGDRNPDGNVDVSAISICYGFSSCQSRTFKTTVKFGNGFAEVMVEPNAVYAVEATFDCPEVDSNWTIPVPAGEPNLSVSNSTNSSVSLTWDAFLDPCPPLSYIIEVIDPAHTFETPNTTFEVPQLQPYTSYTFRLTALFDGHRQLDWSQEVTERTGVGVPHAPTELNKTSVENTTVELRWKEPDISTGPILKYRIRWKITNGDWSGIDTVNNQTRGEVSGLNPYQWYTFSVSAETEAGPGDWSEEIEVQTKIGVPHAPTALTNTSIGNTTVGLSWTAPDISTGPIIKYRMRWKINQGEWTEVHMVDNETHTEVDGLDPYQWYTFSVSAETKAGSGNWSDELILQTKVGVPHAPTALTNTSLSNTTVRLSWKAPDISTGPILKYRIRWNVSNGQRTELETVGSDTHGKVEGLDPYQWYTFSVSAETEAGSGNWSDDLILQTTVGVPHAPTALTNSSVSNTTVGLSWKEPDISTGPIVKYRIRWKVTNGQWTEIETVGSDTHGEVEGLHPYQWYTFSVSAETEAGLGNWSDDLTVQTSVGVPYAPTGLTNTSVSNTTVGLSWKAPDVSTGPIMKYKIRWKVTNGEWTGLETVGNDTHGKVKGLVPYQWYNFSVSGETEAGLGKWSEVLQVQTEEGVPHAPTALTNTSVGNTTVGLSWNAPDVSTGLIREYRIRWRTGGGDWNERPTGTNDTFYEMVGLHPYRWYTFKVSAVTSVGAGNWSEGLTVMTDVGVPYAPTALNRTSVGNTTVGLAWKAPDISTGPILKYRILWKTTKGGSQEQQTGSNETRDEVKGLDPYEWYTFAVSAETEVGQGSWSDVLKVQTKEGVPSVPRQLRLERKTDVSLQISWTRPEFIRSDEIQYVVTWKVDDDSGQGSQSNTVVGGDADQETVRYLLTDLLPYTTYAVRVSAKNTAGIGPATDAFRVQTGVAVPRAALIRSVSVLHQAAARVVWSTEGPFPGPVRYSVQAWRYAGPCSSRVSAVMDKEVTGNEGPAEWISVRPTVVQGLTPGERYSFVVLLSTSASDGVESHKSDNLTMPPAAPGPPKNVIADCLWSSTEARISWDPPSSPNGQIVRYQIRYGIMGQSEIELLVIEVSNACQHQRHVISGLRPERRYRVTVSAMTKGVSERGTPATHGGACQLPAGVPFLGNTSRLVASSASSRQVTLEWTEDTFSDFMGEIVRYAVLLGKENALGESTSGRTGEQFPPWSNFSSGASDFYQVTPTGWNPFRNGDDPLSCTNETLDKESNRTLLRCTLGGQWPCPENTTYCNGPLQPDTPYQLKIRGFTRGGYNETMLLYVRTDPLPKKSVAGAVAAAVVSLLLIGAAAGGCYVLYRKGFLDSFASAVWFKLHPPKDFVPESTESSQEMRNSKRNSRPVPTHQFSEHVRRMMSDSHLQFSQEFEELKAASPSLPCTVAESEENRAKNRWMNIFPFDHSRVKLLPLCDDPGSDFINASYIPGLSSLREYIASQGPLPHTVDDFWRMAWEQSVTTIVMLTQCTERGKRKCEAYWPEQGEARHYGDLSVTTVSESMLATHVIRVIRLQLGSYERQIKQIHFMHWPDFGCPDRPEDLIEFIGAVRDHLPRRNPGPILVHCSAGVGRTGTFIAVDRLWRQLQGSAGDQEVDVYGTVLQLRHHRTNMVQTEDQYIYIHLCVQRLLRAWEHPAASITENIYSNLAELDTSF